MCHIVSMVLSQPVSPILWVSQKQRPMFYPVLYTQCCIPGCLHRSQYMIRTQQLWAMWTNISSAEGAPKNHWSTSEHRFLGTNSGALGVHISLNCFSQGFDTEGSLAKWEHMGPPLPRRLPWCTEFGLSVHNIICFLVRPISLLQGNCLLTGLPSPSR